MSKSQKFWMSSPGLSKLEYLVVSFVFTICLSSIEFTGWLPLYILRRRMNSLNIICCYEFGTRTILVKIPSEWPKQSLKIFHRISYIWVHNFNKHKCKLTLTYMMSFTQHVFQFKCCTLNPFFDGQKACDRPSTDAWNKIRPWFKHSTECWDILDIINIS